MKKSLAGLIVIVFLALLLPAPAAADTHCVNTTGSGGCATSIQAAITAAASGDTVSVAAGTYYGNISLKAGVQVIGAGAGSSIIQGSGGGAAVQAASGGIGTNTLLQGFTITAGNGQYGGGIVIFNGAAPSIKNNLIASNYSSGSGGGILVLPGSNPIIQDNIIMGNSSAAGAGIYVDGASPTITGNQITSNNATVGTAGQGGGMVIINGASPVVSSNVISGNVSSCDGGGLVIQNNAAPTVTGNTIQNNRTTGSSPCGIGGGVKYYSARGLFENNAVRDNITATDGGGVYVEHSSTPTINRNKIIGNQARGYAGGMIISDGSNPVVTNNYIARNRASNNGGGIFIHTTNPVIRNNTIVANNATGPGQGIYMVPVSAAPTIVNNIIANNNYGIARPGGAFNGVENYNDVWNNATNYYYISSGPNDISADPSFVNAAGDNYQLNTGSPAIDAGTNTSAPATDIDGVARPKDGNGDGSAITDMGAHEASPPEAQLAVSPDQTVFRYDPDDPAKYPTSSFTGSITIRNTGSSKALSYTITPPSSPPFPVTPLDSLSGSVGAGGSTSFRYRINVSGLVTGTYSAAFTISATQANGGAVPGSPATSQVRAIIGSPGSVYLPFVVKN